MHLQRLFLMLASFMVFQSSYSLPGKLSKLKAIASLLTEL